MINTSLFPPNLSSPTKDKRFLIVNLFRVQTLFPLFAIRYLYFTMLKHQATSVTLLRVGLLHLSSWKLSSVTVTYLARRMYCNFVALAFTFNLACSTIFHLNSLFIWTLWLLHTRLHILFCTLNLYNYYIPLYNYKNIT